MIIVAIRYLQMIGKLFYCIVMKGWSIFVIKAIVWKNVFWKNDNWKNVFVSILVNR